MDMQLSNITTTPLPAFYASCSGCGRDLKFAFAEQTRTCPVCNVQTSLPGPVVSLLQARVRPVTEEQQPA